MDFAEAGGRIYFVGAGFRIVKYSFVKMEVHVRYMMNQGVKPTEQLYIQLKDLLSCDTVFGQPMPLEKMELRGLKPKYLVECGRETQAVAEHFYNRFCM